MPTKTVNGERQKLTEQEAIDWNAQGLASAEFVSVPNQVTAYQAKAALYNAGHYGDVSALMSSPEVDTLALIAWENATTFRRESPFIAAIAPALGLSDSDIDDLFRAAVEIE